MRSWKPRDSQERMLSFMLENPAAGIFADPGLGKTSTTLAAYTILKQEGVIGSALIVAPLAVVKTTWPNEISKWSDFSHLEYRVLHGKVKKDAMWDDADLYFCTPEGLTWLAGQDWDWPDMLVIDESTRYKNTNTKRSKSLRLKTHSYDNEPVLDKFTRRYILTGTPAPNGYLDLYGQIFILDCGERLGYYKTMFLEDYFYKGWDGFSWEMKPGSDKLIEEAISDIVIRIDIADEIDLPDLIENEIVVELPAEAREIYRETERDFICLLEEGKIRSANAGAAMAKCRQIASGFCYLSGDRGERLDEWSCIHTEKLEALQHLLEELSGQPCIVVYEFEHEKQEILKQFDTKERPITVGVARKFKQIADDWNAGNIPVLLLHAASAAHGLNLQEGGRHLIWYTLTWNLENHEQMIRRLLRPGQHHTVICHYLMAKDTVDFTVRQTLAEKDAVQEDLLKALMEQYLEREDESTT